MHGPLPIECFREIAEKLPQTKSQMLEIDQMTEFRFEKFGSYLIQVCQDHNTKRLNYLEDKQLAIMKAKEEEAKRFPMQQSINPNYGINPNVQNMPKPTSSNRGWPNSRGLEEKGHLVQVIIHMPKNILGNDKNL